MGVKTIKVDAEIHDTVVMHTTNIGGKIGKFYDLAAQEKLTRDIKTRFIKKNEIKEREVRKL